MRKRQLVTVLAAGGPSDTTRPTCTITSTASGATVAAFTCTFTFSEAVTGFALGDITVSANASAGTFATVSTSVYTAVITPTATGTVTVDVNAGVCTDAAGNTNTASNTFSILYMAAVLWLRADDVSGNDGDAVTTWTSREGGGYAFTQSDADKKPVLKKTTNGINGRNALLFDGSNDLLRYAGTISTASSGTVFIVYKPLTIDASNREMLGSCDEATNNYYIAFRANHSFGNTTKAGIAQKSNDTEDSLKGSTVCTINTSYLGTWISDGAAYTLRLNGVGETLSAISGSNTGDWFGDTANRDSVTIGALKLSVEVNAYHGLIAEIIVIDAAITGTPLSAVEAYLDGIYDTNP